MGAGFRFWTRGPRRPAAPVPGIQLSPIAEPFETHREAKVWRVVPLASGERHEVRSLGRWCRDNPHLFAPDPWERAHADLRQAQAWLVGSAPLRVSRWKGWTLERAAQAPEGE